MDYESLVKKSGLTKDEVEYFRKNGRFLFFKIFKDNCIEYYKGKIFPKLNPNWIPIFESEYDDIRVHETNIEDIFFTKTIDIFCDDCLICNSKDFDLVKLECHCHLRKKDLDRGHRQYMTNIMVPLCKNHQLENYSYSVSGRDEWDCVDNFFVLLEREFK